MKWCELARAHVSLRVSWLGRVGSGRTGRAVFAGLLPVYLLPTFGFIDPSSVNPEVLRESSRSTCVSLYVESMEGRALIESKRAQRKAVNDEMWYPSFVREIRRFLGISRFKSEAEMLSQYRKSLFVEVPHCRSL